MGRITSRLDWKYRFRTASNFSYVARYTSNSLLQAASAIVQDKFVAFISVTSVDHVFPSLLLSCVVERLSGLSFLIVARTRLIVHRTDNQVEDTRNLLGNL